MTILFNKLAISGQRNTSIAIACFVISSLTQSSFSQDTGCQKLIDAGTAAYKKHDYNTAEKCFSSAVDNASGNNKQLSKALNDLALTLAAQGKSAEAEAGFKHALDVKTEMFGPESIELVPTLNNLGRLYSQLADEDKAEKYYSQALAITEKTNGANHASVAVCLNNLASVYRQERKFEEAKRLLERALCVAESNFGKNSDAAAIELNNLGKIYEDQGNTEEAKRLYAQALSVKTKTR